MILYSLFFFTQNFALQMQVDKATKEVESLRTRLGKYEDVDGKALISGICKFEEDVKIDIANGHTQ